MTQHATDNAAAWLETIKDHISRLKVACRPDAPVESYELLREEIQEAPLCLSVRSLWTDLGAALRPEQFCILLSTGGPGLRIVGDLGTFGCPENSCMEWQDWGTPWTPYAPAESALLDAWAAQFYWGDS